MPEASPIEIRPAEPSDAEAIDAVATAAWETDYPSVLNRENVTDAAHEWYEPSSMSESLTDPRTVAFVACKADGEVVGFVHAYDDAGRERPEAIDTEEDEADGYLFRVYVHPEYRGESVGSDLVEAAVEDLHERDCERVRATVLAENEAGQSFYEAMGFEREGVTGETEVGGDYYEEVSFVEDRA